MSENDKRRVCPHCGGAGRWASGVSAVTGETFYSTCPVCDGKHTIPIDDPDPARDTEKDRKKLGEKHARENLEKQIQAEIMKNARRASPEAFR